MFSTSASILALASGGKCFFDVDLADRLAEPVVDQVHAALPALALLLAAGQRLAEEREVLVVDRLGQVRRVVVDVVIGQVRLPVVERLRARRAPPRPCTAVGVLTLKRSHAADVHGVEHRLPVEAGRERHQLRAALRVVVGDGVARPLGRPSAPGRSRVSSAMIARRLARGVGDARQRQHAADVRLIGGADLLELRVVLQVVVAVGQARGRTAPG